jgi:hypothetical protein
MMVAAACGPGASPASPASAARSATRSLGGDRPALAVVAREGDPSGAFAVAAVTEGIAPERGAVVGVALAALVEARLAARGGDFGGAVTVGGWGGWRMRGLVSAANAAAWVSAVRDAMLVPVAPDDPALEAVRRKIDALAHRPLPDRAMADVAACTGEAFGLGGDAAPTAAELEAWRRAAHGTSRVALAVAGDQALATAVAEAVSKGPAWPAAGPPTPTVASPVGPTVVYDAGGEIPGGAARVVVVARTASPERAVQGAAALGDPRAPLASRLAALDTPAKVRSVIATAHPDGGCAAVTLDIAARDLSRDAPARIATAASLARQEIAVQLAGSSSAVADFDPARLASDPRDAAERAAWWALAGRGPGSDDDVRTSLFVGLAAPRVAEAGAPLPFAEVRSEIDRATIAWHAPVVEARTRVEHGQGDTWILLASPCGPAGEGDDAGSGAAAVMAAAMQASRDDARAEPFVASDGLGVLVHGAARPGESPVEQARRLADVAARSFAADPLERSFTARARTTLLGTTSEFEARLLAAAGTGVAPGHPSWLVALGDASGIASLSDEDVLARVSALRAGPLRVAVVASADEAQAEAAVRAVDRWVARRPGETRACPSAPTVRPRPGTYAVELAPGSASEALLVLPVPREPSSHAAAEWLAATLDGADGLLAHALGAGTDARALATAWSAGVAGGELAPALVLRVVADDAQLDPAVAQVRGLLDRLRQGALRDEDLARATRVLEGARRAASMDPRARTIALWRGSTSAPPPTLDALRGFATATLHDDGLVVVAARPPRSPRPTTTRSR